MFFSREYLPAIGGSAELLVGVTRTERSPVLSLALAGSTKFSSGATSTQARYGCAGSLTQRREGSAELASALTSSIKMESDRDRRSPSISQPEPIQGRGMVVRERPPGSPRCTTMADSLL